MARHNWDEIRKEYIEGMEQDGQLVYPTQKSIADKYGIAPETVNRKAKAEQWEVQREIFVNKTSIKRQEKKAELISDEGSQFDLDCFNAAKAGIEKIQHGIGNCFLVEDLNKLSSALKNFQTVGKASLGDKTTGDNTIIISWDNDA
ncbi:MAG: hypothetical protein H6Q73_189 [Firmicutes bacterium]|nr:hypothetical protein [Bacillota bacterium]